MSDEHLFFPIARRTILRATGAVALVGVGAGPAVAQREQEGQEETPNGDDNRGGGPEPNDLSPIFGYASAEPSPCLGDAGEDCFDAFKAPVRPSHEVELHIEVSDTLLALGEQGVLAPETVEAINAAVADGELSDSERTELDEQVTDDLTAADVAELLVEATGFHYEPTGLTVEPGDVVIFTAETPDHGVAGFHERHGRQNRLPDDVGPIASPLVPVGGYWLYQFETPGVYDLYCPPHEVFGMVMRVVVTDGDVPELSVEETGRPPLPVNLLPVFLGGLDPNVPSSAAALDSDALAPENIVDAGTVSWEDVVSEHRSAA